MLTPDWLNNARPQVLKYKNDGFQSGSSSVVFSVKLGSI